MSSAYRRRNTTGDRIVTHEATGPVLIGFILCLAIPYLLHRIPAIRKTIPLIVLFIIWAVFLSPSGLGAFAPEIQQRIISPELVRLCQNVGFFGIIMYLVKTGAHIEFKRGPESGRASLVAITSTVFPMVIGSLGALGLMSIFGTETFIGEHGNKELVVIAIALSCTVSALAVLSSIYHDQGLMGTARSRLAMLIATAHEVGVWTIVAYIFSNMHGLNSHQQSPAMTFGLAILFVVFMFAMKKTVLTWIGHSQWWTQLPSTVKILFITLAGFAACFSTHTIGVHYAFGAIVFGAMLPEPCKHMFEEKVGDICMIFINIYFMGALLSIDVDIASPVVITIYLVMLIITYAGQLVGATIPLKLTGMSWKDSIIQALDLTVKGVVEVVVNTSFLSVGLISPVLFTATMLMAATATAINVPLSRLVERRKGATHVAENTARAR